MATMKALRASKAENGSISLNVEDVPVPTPKAGEILVKIKAATVMPADQLNARGGFPSTTFPRTMGKDFAGTVAEGPSSLKGKNVFGTSGTAFSFTVDGAQAEYAVVKEGAVALMPDNLSFAQASGLGTPWTTANVTLKRSGAQPGETVMVLGATGQVGGAVMQLAKHVYGCKTISVGRHGTDIDSTKDPDLKTAKDLSDGKGPDVVVDTVGDFNLTHAAINALALRGRISFISAPRSGSTQLAVDILDLYRREISLVGCNSVSKSSDYTQEALAAVLGELAPYFADGKLTGPQESAMNLLPLQRAAEAYNGSVKKAVIVME